MISLSWEKTVLPNGTRALIFPRASDKTALLCLGFEYGSNADVPSNAGLAHLLEHMLAGGSTRRVELSRSLEREGGLFNCETYHEHTLVYADVLPDKLENAAQTLREIAYCQSFEEDRLQKERKIVLHEIADAKDNPEARVQDMLLKSLFRTHPTGRPISGFSNTVKTISIKMIRESHRIHYAPQNTILVLTGRFDEDEKNSVLGKFADVPKSRFAQNKPLSTEEKKPGKKQTVQRRAGLAQTYVATGTRTVPAKHQNRYALDIINVLMGYGASSRLFIELREKNTLTYNVETRHHVGSDFGYFSAYCAIKKGKMEKTRSLVRREFEKVRTQKLSDKELRKCKDMIRGYVLRTLDDHLGCAGLLIEEETQFQNQYAISDYLERIESVPAREIKEIANKYLTEDRFSTAILEPT